MHLKRIAKFFDRDPVYDGYTGNFLYKAQYASYEGNTLDGGFVRRRTVSMAPEIVLPTRRVGSTYGELWIIGNTVIDGFYSEPIRKTASAKLVTELFQIMTPGEAASHAGSQTTAYACTEFLKNTVNTPMDAEYDPQYTVSFGASETLTKGMFLKSDKLYLSVRTVQANIEGFIELVADQLAINNGSWDTDPEVVVELQGPMDPITEQPAPSTSHTGLFMDMYKLYQYATTADPLSKPGDKSLITGTKFAAGDRLSISGEAWLVLTVQAYHDAYLSHIRRI